MNKITIYLFSGLGADKRAFNKLIFPPNFELKFIDWMSPYKNETILNYAIRLSKKINTEKPFILIGLSFGGIIVTELMNIIDPNKAIIISSIKNKTELPSYLRIAKALRLYKIIPESFLNRPNFILYKMFGVNNNEERELIMQILNDSDTKFMKWAINTLLNWKVEQSNNSIIHIHGTNDKMLPIKYIKNCIKIKDGGHLMVYSMAPEISKTLREELSL